MRVFPAKVETDLEYKEVAARHFHTLRMEVVQEPQGRRMAMKQRRIVFLLLVGICFLNNPALAQKEDLHRRARTFRFQMPQLGGPALAPGTLVDVVATVRLADGDGVSRLLLTRIPWVREDDDSQWPSIRVTLLVTAEQARELEHAQWRGALRWHLSRDPREDAIQWLRDRLGWRLAR